MSSSEAESDYERDPTWTPGMEDEPKTPARGKGRGRGRGRRPRSASGSPQSVSSEHEPEQMVADDAESDMEETTARKKSAPSRRRSKSQKRVTIDETPMPANLKRSSSRSAGKKQSATGKPRKSRMGRVMSGIRKKTGMKRGSRSKTGLKKEGNRSKTGLKRASGRSKTGLKRASSHSRPSKMGRKSSRPSSRRRSTKSEDEEE